MSDGEWRICRIVVGLFVNAMRENGEAKVSPLASGYMNLNTNDAYPRANRRCLGGVYLPKVAMLTQNLQLGDAGFDHQLGGGALGDGVGNP